MFWHILSLCNSSQEFSSNSNPTFGKFYYFQLNIMREKNYWKVCWKILIHIRMQNKYLNVFLQSTLSGTISWNWDLTVLAFIWHLNANFNFEKQQSTWKHWNKQFFLKCLMKPVMKAHIYRTYDGRRARCSVDEGGYICARSTFKYNNNYYTKLPKQIYTETLYLSVRYPPLYSSFGSIENCSQLFGWVQEPC